MLQLQAGHMDPAHCIAKVCPSFLSSPAVGDIVGVPMARKVSVPLQGWDRAQGSCGLGQRDTNLTPAEGRGCFGLAPSL